ncbi:unnamed protein product [Phytophthora fragariaefolia]|uniref:Unnamed protein product n=1 Tax=Phytophthora fragariaefolia TaxID=1490495 RepID=A0A9W6U1L5_9STRA|nr:unnamed protein product [Phytophthora fragariaefolia]
MQRLGTDEVSDEHAPSLEELAGEMQLVHDPDSWEEDQEVTSNSNYDGRTDGGMGVDFDPGAELQDETRAVEDCTMDRADEDDGQAAALGSEQVDVDQLQPLSPEQLHPKKTSANRKFKERQAALDPPPATLFDVHPLLEFAHAHFNLVALKTTIFHKPTEFDLNKRLEWENNLTSTPLTRLPKDQATIAVQVFRNISGFMGNRSSGKNQIDHCFKLLRNVVPRSPALKDEIYCQLCKQLTRNPSSNAVLNGWLLLNACLVTFPPSPPLAECLERFISVHIGTSGDSEASLEVSAYAQEALKSLRCCVTKGERKEIPSAAELKALQRHALNDVTVMVADGSSLVIQVSAWTTSRDLTGLVAHKLGVSHEKAFALFETSNDGEEHLVPDNERVMDLYAEWERTHVVSEPKQKNKKGVKDEKLIGPGLGKAPSAVIEGYHLLYKAYLWVHVDDETAADVGLYYLQAVQNVLNGRYVCDLNVAVELAGYQLFCTLGNGNAPELTNLVYVMQIEERHIINRASMAEQVLDSYNSFLNNWCVQSTQQARLAYLRLCKHQPFYGLTLFRVKNFRQLRVLPARIILAINVMGISILAADSDEMLAMLPYADIASWGYSANSFVFIVVRGSEETEYSFKTVQVSQLHIVQYITALMLLPCRARVLMIMWLPTSIT